VAIPALFELLQDEALYQYLPFPPSRSFEELATRLEVDVRSGGEVFTVHLEGGPELSVGFCRFRFDEPGRFEFGYTIGRAFWGNGYATRVVAALLVEVRRRFSVGEAVAAANIGNVASIRALGKNEFLYLGATETILNLKPSYDLLYSRKL
jgi:RimJ/RimL family protein N-acetyltransferase